MRPNHLSQEYHYARRDRANGQDLTSSKNSVKMDKLDRKSRGRWFDKAFNRLLRAKSKERHEDENRDPHKVPSPFVLEAPHTHQNS